MRITCFVYLFLPKVEPYVRLRSVKAVGSRHPSMLSCSAYSFYPRRIRITWLRNGQEATSDVTSTEELPDGNWLYQFHSYLEFTSRPGEKISCKVEHASLKQPKIYDWGKRVTWSTTGDTGLKINRSKLFFDHILLFCINDNLPLCDKCVFRGGDRRVREEQDCSWCSWAAAGSGVLHNWADLLQEERCW